MPGTDRVRHCVQCDKNVYNLSAMTRREAETLLRETEGHLCARLYRREDGTILTENCSAGLRAIGAKVSRWAGALMSLSAMVVAQIPLVQIASAQQQSSEYAISGVLQDLTGATIPGAKITVRKEYSDQTFRTVSDAKGRFRIESLASGSYQIIAEMPGFATFQKWLLIGPIREVQLTATMTLGTMGEVVIVERTKK